MCNKKMSHSVTPILAIGTENYIMTGESNPQRRVEKDRLHSQESLLVGVCDAHQVHVSFWHSLRASVQVRVFRIILYRLFWYFIVSEVFCKVCLLSISVCKKRKKKTTHLVSHEIALKFLPIIMYFRYYLSVLDFG